MENDDRKPGRISKQLQARSCMSSACTGLEIRNISLGLLRVK